MTQIHKMKYTNTTETFLEPVAPNIKLELLRQKLPLQEI